MWQPGSLKITKGADAIGTYNKTPKSFREWCRTCGGHLVTEHPGMGLNDIHAASIPAFPYHAGIHVHYAETRLPMRDGSPKMQDLPAEMGGSGKTLAE